MPALAVEVESCPPPELLPVYEDHKRAFKASISDMGSRLLDVRDRRLYLFEYSSFDEFCKTEFEVARSRAYEKIMAAKVAQSVSEISDTLPESQLRALAPLPPEERVAAYEEAAADGKPTAAKVKAVVNRRLGKAKAEAKPAGKSIVDGELKDDPEHIAELRAKGKIGPDTVPEVATCDEPTSASGVAEEIAERKGKTQDDLSDEDWLAQFPQREKLSGAQLKTFDEDALAYRAIEQHRNTFAYHVTRAINKIRRKGEYCYRLTSFLGIDGPAKWIVCAALDQGGCGGRGTIGVIGQCPACRGRGYRING